MARGVSWGTPGRAKHYVPLRAKSRFLAPALMLGLAALVLPLSLHVAGWRGSLSPGAVTSPHAPFEARCEECHTPRAGVADRRCQRCHDASGAGRLTGASHVLFGSGDPRKAAASEPRACVGCHVDHHGRDKHLASVDERQCGSCHFRSFGAHPEFALLRDKAVDAPGIKFPHERHMRELRKQGVSDKDACLRCHEPAGPGRDLQPIAFDRQCASCHAKDGSVGLVEPIPLEDVVPPSELMARGGVNFRMEEFDESRGRIAKTALRHRDDWVVFNLRQLWRELDPPAFAAARSALAAREAQLARRLALAAPLAGLDEEALRSREAALAAELQGLDARIAGQAQAAATNSGLERLREVATAASATGDSQAAAAAQALVARAEPLREAAAGPLSLPSGEVEARRKEILTLLDATAAADPELQARAADLRRRLMALAPGEPAAELLGRVRDQRRAELARVSDEIVLRERGVRPPAVALLAADQGSLRDALASVRERLAALDRTSARPPLDDATRARRRAALELLTAACRKCHQLEGDALAPLHAARPRLVRARFEHAPHLMQAECSRCHQGIEASARSSDLFVPGIASCRECHGPRAVRADCVTCHRYHPEASP
jgi:hypothetical protein